MRTQDLIATQDLATARQLLIDSARLMEALVRHGQRSSWRDERAVRLWNKAGSRDARRCRLVRSIRATFPKDDPRRRPGYWPEEDPRGAWARRHKPEEPILIRLGPGPYQATVIPVATAGRTTWLVVWPDDTEQIFWTEAEARAAAQPLEETHES